MTQKTSRGRTKYIPSIKQPTLKSNEYELPEVALKVAKEQGKKVERFILDLPDKKGRVFKVTFYRVI
jgi:hypothetical protein